jgi:hypothetical protein
VVPRSPASRPRRPFRPPVPAPEPVPAPAPEPGPVLAPERADALAPARAWWNRRPRGRTPLLAGLGVALVVVLALAGYLAAVAIGNAKYPPDQPVRALFAALAARDPAAAAKLATCTTPACTGTALATGYEPPTDLQLGEISYGDPTDNTQRPDKSIAYVPVSYRLGRAEQAVIMRVQRTGTGLARPFRIMSGATGRLAVTAGRLDQVQVGGAKVPTDEQGLTVLPGRYTSPGPRVRSAVRRDAGGPGTGRRPRHRRPAGHPGRPAAARADPARSRRPGRRAGPHVPHRVRPAGHPHAPRLPLPGARHRHRRG